MKCVLMFSALPCRKSTVARGFPVAGMNQALSSTLSVARKASDS